MNNENVWVPVAQKMPPEGELVLVKFDHIQNSIFSGFWRRSLREPPKASPEYKTITEPLWLTYTQCGTTSEPPSEWIDIPGGVKENALDGSFNVYQGDLEAKQSCWTRTEEELPPENELVWIKLESSDNTFKAFWTQAKHGPSWSRVPKWSILGENIIFSKTPEKWLPIHSRMRQKYSEESQGDTNGCLQNNLHEVDKGRTVNQAWFSAKEKEPPQDEAVIVCYEGETSRALFLGYYGKDGWEISTSKEVRLLLRTPDLWMKVPSITKGGLSLNE